MSMSTYTPREGSVVSKVIAFLTANPEEQLDADIISAKFDCDRRGVHTILGQAVQAALLHRAEDKPTGELIYTLGTRKQMPEARQVPPRSATPVAQPPKRKPPASPFRVDLSTIKVDKDVALPSRRPVMDWTPLLDKLEIGDSFAVPYAARSSISSAVKAYKDATDKVLVCRTQESEIRVWRTK